MFAVIVDRDAPFAVVVLQHQRIVRAHPGAPFHRPAHCTLTFGSTDIPGLSRCLGS